MYDGDNGGWSPALTLGKVAISLRSMLASNSERVRCCSLLRCIKHLFAWHNLLFVDARGCHATDLVLFEAPAGPALRNGQVDDLKVKIQTRATV